MPDATPVSHFADTIALGGGSHRHTLHAYPRYWRQGDEWRTLRQAFSVVDANTVEATEGVHKLRVGRNGLVRCRHLGAEMAFRLRGFAAIGATGDDSETLPIDLAQWSLDKSRLDQGIITWEHGTGARYQVQYTSDRVRDRFILTDQARALIRSRLPTGATRFGLVFATSGLGKTVETEGRIAWDTAGSRQWLRPSWMADSRYPCDAFKVWRERWRLRPTVMIQTLPVEALDHVAELNTEITYQEGVDTGDGAYSGCEDTYMYNYSSYPTRNMGSAPTAVIYGGREGKAFIRWDLISYIPAGATINDVTFTYQQDSAGGTGAENINLWRCLQNWVEGTGNPYSGEGSHSALDGTYYERATGAWDSAFASTSGTDFSATVSDSAAQISNSAGDWQVFNDAQMVTDAQNWLDSVWTNNGWLIWYANGVASDRNAAMRSSEYGTSASRPKLTVDYTAAAAGQPTMRRWRGTPFMTPGPAPQGRTW